MKLNILEQKTLDNFVEIVKVPEIINEDCKNTVKKLFSLIEVYVVNAYRVQSKFNNRSKKIIAKLTSKQVKKNLMKSSRKIKPTGNSVEASWKNEGIYINDNLKQFNRNPFYKTKIFASDLGYKFVWFRDYKLFIKKTELTKTIVIVNELSLTILTKYFVCIILLIILIFFYLMESVCQGYLNYRTNYYESFSEFVNIYNNVCDN